MTARVVGQGGEATVADNQLSLSDLLLSSGGGAAMGESLAPYGRQETLAIAEVEWRAAIAAVIQLLAASPRPTDQAEGAVISGPLPIVTEPALTQRFATWVLTPQPLADALMGQRSLPAAHFRLAEPTPMIQVLPLQASDGLLREQFCLVHTAPLTLVLVLGQPTGEDWQFQYSFDPGVLTQVWQRLRSSILPSRNQTLGRLAERLADLAAVRPDYRLITRFNQLLLAHLPHRTPGPQPDNIRFAAWSPVTSNHLAAGVNGASARRSSSATRSSSASRSSSPQNSTDDSSAGISRSDCLSLDAELLQAMAHEIRTPLTTIRTLTRSLLRRSNLDAKATQRLQRIDQECTQQIERFNLISGQPN
ncbi:MAG: hypothetical protein HC812_13295 [Leptolyngbya sp. RL_3_1]|nr:hypothetical protein [Leptolyngbya sp. RL_3_1]